LVENVSERTLERNYLLSLISNNVQTNSIVTYSYPLVNAAGTTYDGAQIVVTQDDATAASEDASMAIKLMVAGVNTTNLQMTGNKVGFYGVTPVVKAVAITSPDTTGAQLKTAVDAIRVALTNLGLTA
jgi:hypothetical protein